MIRTKKLVMKTMRRCVHQFSRNRRQEEGIIWLRIRWAWKMEKEAISYQQVMKIQSYSIAEYLILICTVGTPVDDAGLVASGISSVLYNDGAHPEGQEIAEGSVTDLDQRRSSRKKKEDVQFHGMKSEENGRLNVKLIRKGWIVEL